ncbi:hypothetical protein BT67DRAFT_433361 [Trichocladium antarcticum]|uniref:Uncharacterized protein n=1 Tax=Trichocladium antarcticum TaxID=1450529 RepID=A0AAN6ULP2_9PEZI|nr:hypothetical protein BT67DRAFT_433361 [Trichocladium antarcticum]
MYSVWDTVKETGGSKEDLDYMLNRLVSKRKANNCYYNTCAQTQWEGHNLYGGQDRSNFNIYVASIVFVLNLSLFSPFFYTLTNTPTLSDPTVQAPCEHFIPPVPPTVTEGNNTSPAAAPAAAAPAAAAPAAAATAAAALAALAALPDLEPDPIYNISIPPPPPRVTTTPCPPPVPLLPSSRKVPLPRPPPPRKKKKKVDADELGLQARSVPCTVCITRLYNRVIRACHFQARNCWLASRTRASTTRSGTSTRKSARPRTAFQSAEEKSSSALERTTIANEQLVGIGTSLLDVLREGVAALGENNKLLRQISRELRAEPARAEPARAEPERAEPERAEPERAEPEPTKG